MPAVPSTRVSRRILLELGIVLSLKGIQFASEFGIGGQHLPQASERSHDFDIDLNGTAAAQHATEHGHAVFGKGIGTIASSSIT